MRTLDIDGRAESARRARSVNSVGGADTDADDRPAQEGSHEAAPARDAGGGASDSEGREAAGGSSSSRQQPPPPAPLQPSEGDDDRGPLSPTPDASTFPLSSTPIPPTDGAFAQATAASFPRPSSPHSSSPDADPTAAAQGIPHDSPQQHHHHHHHHHHHGHGIRATVSPPASRPAYLGTTDTHSASHPGTIMYPQPDDDDDEARPRPGDRSRPSQDRVQKMHEAIDQREKDYEAEQDARERKKTSDQADEAARARSAPARLPLPAVIVRDFAYAPDDERFAGQGPLRASLFLSREEEPQREPGSAWGFGGWKADSPSGGRERSDEEEEEEWQDDDDDDHEGEYDDDDGHPADDADDEEVEQGVYQALYPCVPLPLRALVSLRALASKRD